MPYLNTAAPWWNQSAIEGLTMGGGLYCLTGDVAFLSLLGGAYVMFVNDKLCETYDIESIPALVRDGGWTMDAMTQITKNIRSDLDGSGVMDEKDLYGLVLDLYNSAESFYTAADVHQITVTDGIPSYVPAEERMTKLMELAYPLYYNGEMVGSYMTQDVTLQVNMFRGRQALMIVRELDSARSEFREMEDNYTIIPMPKLDETQESYRTAAYNGAAVWGIPSDNPDTETALMVMEAMAAETYYNVTPVYFETCLQEKYARNEETLEMLEIIRETLYLDSEYLWGGSLGNPAYIMRNMLSAKKSDVASWMAKNEKAINRAVDKTVEKLENIQNQ